MIKKIMDWLYNFEETSLVEGFKNYIFLVMLATFFKLIMTGIEQKLLTSYFEVLISFMVFTIFLFLLINRLRFNNFFGIIYIFQMLGIVIWIKFDNYRVFLFGSRLLGVFIGILIIYSFIIYRQNKLEKEGDKPKR